MNLQIKYKYLVAENNVLVFLPIIVIFVRINSISNHAKIYSRISLFVNN